MARERQDLQVLALSVQASLRRAQRLRLAAAQHLAAAEEAVIAARDWRLRQEAERERRRERGAR